MKRTLAGDQKRHPLHLMLNVIIHLRILRAKSLYQTPICTASPSKSAKTSRGRTSKLILQVQLSKMREDVKAPNNTNENRL
jgi:hypothetical protein